MTMADPNANGKTNRFVGICIQRGGKGLGATFVLRNIIDNQGERFLLSIGLLYVSWIFSLFLERLYMHIPFVTVQQSQSHTLLNRRQGKWPSGKTHLSVNDMFSCV